MTTTNQDIDLRDRIQTGDTLNIGGRCIGIQITGERLIEVTRVNRRSVRTNHSNLPFRFTRVLSDGRLFFTNGVDTATL